MNARPENRPLRYGKKRPTDKDAEHDGSDRSSVLTHSGMRLFLGPTNCEVGQQILAGFCWDTAGGGQMQGSTV